MTDESIFAKALAIPDPAARAAFLDRACGGNPALRREVDELLAAHAGAGSFLAGPPAGAGTGTFDPAAAAAPGPAGTTDHRPAEEVGGRVGPYKLLQKLGEGGMGAVWVAEQAAPVRRRVALKVIKPGMDTARVVARFEAERQALALMDHSNIAKVFDAGTTPEGRPYFVMELVKGVPITTYCDELHLSIRDRLGLFVQVCAAVQHAHQKGVIHRDIKPSNVLVAVQDGKPVPKVIDFGVAKALHAKLADRTMYTELGAVIGTLEYMAPEQAELSALDVDTRADVYALGVLLYELLTGTTPLTRQRLRTAAFAEVLRLIREEEPPRPSTRLTESKERIAGLAAARRTDPRRLAGEVRGELDWIVLRALEKDRTRRYESASGFARDVERFLADEPVEARPASGWYRVRKFARRNRAAVAVAGAFLLLVHAGASGIYLAYLRAVAAERGAVAERDRALAAEAEAAANGRRAAAAEHQARDEAAAAKAVRDFLQDDLLGQASVVRQAEGARLGGGAYEAKPNPTVHELLDRAAANLSPDKIEAKFPGLPFVQAEVLKAVGDAYSAVAQDDKAVGLLTRAADLYRAARGPDDPATLAARHSLGYALTYTPKWGDGVALLKAVEADRTRVLGPHHPDTLLTREELGVALYLMPRKEADGLDYFTRLRDDARTHVGPTHLRTLIATAYRADALRDAGRAGEAVREWEGLRAMFNPSAGTARRDHPYYQNSVGMYAQALMAAGRHDDAVKLLDDELAAGLGGRQLAGLLTAVGYSYFTGGRADKAVVAFEKAVAAMPADAPTRFRVVTLKGLGHAYRAVGRAADEVSVREQVRDIETKLNPADHPDVLDAVENLAAAYAGAGRKAEAIPLMEDVIRRLRAARGPAHPQTLGAMMTLCYALYGQPRAAELAAEVVAARRKLVGPTDMTLANELAHLGNNLVLTGRPADGEPALREALRIRQLKDPNGWLAALNKATLGHALLAQKKYAEAEPLLLAGHREMVERKRLMPAYDADGPAAARRHLARLYAETGRPGEAAKWRDKPPPEKAPPPRPAKP